MLVEHVGGTSWWNKLVEHVGGTYWLRGARELLLIERESCQILLGGEGTKGSSSHRRPKRAREQVREPGVESETSHAG